MAGSFEHGNEIYASIKVWGAERLSTFERGLSCVVLILMPRKIYTNGGIKLNETRLLSL
jgi:hypothetical protein